jgi:hypothetical protein
MGELALQGLLDPRVLVVYKALVVLMVRVQYKALQATHIQGLEDQLVLLVMLDLPVLPDLV